VTGTTPARLFDLSRGGTYGNLLAVEGTAVEDAVLQHRPPRLTGLIDGVTKGSGEGSLGGTPLDKRAARSTLDGSGAWDDLRTREARVDSCLLLLAMREPRLAIASQL
jgi:hypothetical protein